MVTVTLFVWLYDQQAKIKPKADKKIYGGNYGSILKEDIADTGDDNTRAGSSNRRAGITCGKPSGVRICMILWIDVS